jgi:hypothetical protein
VALLACGTRTVIDAVFGPTTTAETTYTPGLLRSLRTGMIGLADRNFAAKDLLAQISATAAHVLVRLKNGRKTPVLARYPDGSYLSTLGALRVRILECEITIITTTTGRHTGLYRLATTLLDHHRYPAGDLVRLYHERPLVERLRPSPPLTDGEQQRVDLRDLGHQVVRTRTGPGRVRRRWSHGRRPDRRRLSTRR